MTDFYCQALDVAMVMDASGVQVGIKGRDGYFFLKAIKQEAENTTRYTLTEGIGGKVLPAVAVRTPIKNLQVGDIVVSDGRAVGFYIGVADTKGALANPVLRVVSIEGKIRTFVLPENVFGLEPGVLAVNNTAGMNPMMLAIMGSLEDDEDGMAAEMMELAVMQQFMGGNSNNIFDTANMDKNMLLPFMLGNRKGGIGSFLMMQHIMGNNSTK